MAKYFECRNFIFIKVLSTFSNYFVKELLIGFWIEYLIVVCLFYFTSEIYEGVWVIHWNEFMLIWLIIWFFPSPLGPSYFWAIISHEQWYFCPYPVVTVCIKSCLTFMIQIISFDGYHQSIVALLNVFGKYRLARKQLFVVFICNFVKMHSLFIDGIFMIFDNLKFIFIRKFFALIF